MLCGAPSKDRTLVIAMPAARVTEVGADPPPGALAPTLRTLITRPQRRSRMPGKARRISRIAANRSEEHTSELQSLMRISYAVFCLKKKKQTNNNNIPTRSCRKQDEH